MELYYGTFDFSEYQNVKSTNKLAIIHDNDEKQGEYEMEIENTDKVETGIWKWNDDGYITFSGYYLPVILPCIRMIKQLQI